MNYANDVTIEHTEDGAGIVTFYFDHEATNLLSVTGGRTPQVVAHLVLSAAAMDKLATVSVS